MWGPLSLNRHQSPSIPTCSSPTWLLPEASAFSIIDSVPSHSAPTSGEWENSKLLITAWSSLASASKRPPGVTSSEQKILMETFEHSYPLGIYMGSRSPVSGTRGQRPLYIFSVLSQSPRTQKSEK